MDIFTCGEGFDPKAAAQLMVEQLECKDPELTGIARGYLNVATSIPLPSEQLS